MAASMSNSDIQLLRYCQLYRKIQISRLLFMARANPSIEDIQDRTPIYLAAERGHTHVVDFLADKFKVCN